MESFLIKERPINFHSLEKIQIGGLTTYNNKVCVYGSFNNQELSCFPDIKIYDGNNKPKDSSEGILFYTGFSFNNLEDCSKIQDAFQLFNFSNNKFFGRLDNKTNLIYIDPIENGKIFLKEKMDDGHILLLNLEFTTVQNIIKYFKILFKID